MEKKKEWITDPRIMELTDGLMDQFRAVRKSRTDGDLRLLEGMSNACGKVLKAYCVELSIKQYGNSEISREGDINAS